MNNVVPLLNEVERRLANIADQMPAQENLKHGGGSGTSDNMDTVDAKIAAAEARTDTKFAELRGDLKDFATAKEMRNAVWGAAATIIAVLLAAMAFGGDRFDAGIGMADVRQVQIARDVGQDKAVQRIEGKLDQLIAAQKAPAQK